MSDSKLATIGRTGAALAMGLSLAGVVVLLVAGRWDFLWGDFVVHNALLAFSFGLVAFVAIPGNPRNRAV